MANTNGEDFSAVIQYTGEGVIQPINAETFVVSSSSGVATLTYYLMRGVVSGNDVYWYATTIDTTAAEYTGGGTVTSVRLVKRKQ